MRNTIQFIQLALLLLLQTSIAVAQELEWEVGLSSNRTVIRAQGIRANTPAAPTILYLAGLAGAGEASGRLRSILNAYAQLDEQERSVNLITIAVANPEAESLSFPPSGRAYAEDPVSNALWRWIGIHAPDLIILAAEGEAGLVEALESEGIAGIGSIPVQMLSEASASLEFLLQLSAQEESAAALEMKRRLRRTPTQLAQQLASVYGYDFSTPAYVPGMSLIGRMRLGNTSEVETLIRAYLTGDGVEVANASVMAGHLVFAEYAERTGDERALALAIRAADQGFDEQGNMRPAVPMHNEMSDSVFMATPVLVKVGKLTGATKYFDMAARHVEFMRGLLLRQDGLYRHSPEANVAWGRGNAFPALGLALSLSDFPPSHPAYASLKAAFIQHLEVLRPFQDEDGMWHEVVDYPGSFAELSSTAMLGIAIKRGIDREWLSRETYQPILDNIWTAILARTSLNGEFIDVCTSTGKLQSLDAYLDRLAIFGRDDRAGGMVMLFANEMAGNI
jgi:unsaturated rhamnogalacturonyl hydrolase